MLQEIDGHTRAVRSFAFETMLSGRGHARRIRQWRDDGYSVKLIFLSLAMPEEAIKRVKSRVRQGGYSMSEPVVHRRFQAGMRNFLSVYRHCVDEWEHYDNSGVMPVLQEKGP